MAQPVGREVRMPVEPVFDVVVGERNCLAFFRTQLGQERPQVGVKGNASVASTVGSSIAAIADVDHACLEVNLGPGQVEYLDGSIVGPMGGSAELVSVWIVFTR